MTKNEDDKNRIRFRKQNSGAYNRKVKQKKDELTTSLVGSIQNLFQAKIRNSQPSTSSMVEQISDEYKDIGENVEIHKVLMSGNVDILNEDVINESTNEGSNDNEAMNTMDESNLEHTANLIKWVDLYRGLQPKETIDKRMKYQIDQDRQRWKKILVRIIGVVKTLSRHNLPFRGSNEMFFEENNGLFCQLIEFVAEFDPIMEEHIRLVVNNEINNHYLTRGMQNELILLLAKKIKEMLLTKILKGKFFSVILYCTPDLSNKEQMSIIVRCVDVENASNIKVEEFFLGFIEVDDTSELDLFKKLEGILVDLKLNIDDVRGQSYDNESNMKGKHEGVQKRLVDINPRAFYISCGCYSLNLALCDMAKSCIKGQVGPPP